MGEHSKGPMPGHSQRRCPKCGVVKEYGNEFTDCENCDPYGLTDGTVDNANWALLHSKLHGDVATLAQDRAELMEALRMLVFQATVRRGLLIDCRLCGGCWTEVSGGHPLNALYGTPGCVVGIAASRLTGDGTGGRRG